MARKKSTKKNARKPGKPKLQWVLIRGLAREQAHWGPFRELIESKFGPENIHYLDLPGTGTELDQQCPATIAKITDELRSRAEWRFYEKGISENPVCLVAISLGGMIAVDWLKRYPSDFQYAFIINSSLRGLSPVYRRLQPKAWLKVLRAVFTADAFKREKIVYSLVCNYAEKEKELVDEWAETAMLRPLKRKTFFRQLLAASKFHSPDFINTDTKVTVLTSACDRMVDCHCSFRIAQRYEWPVHVHLHAGHDLTSDQPEWVLGKIEKAIVQSN